MTFHHADLVAESNVQHIDEASTWERRDDKQDEHEQRTALRRPMTGVYYKCSPEPSLDHK